MDDKPIVLPPTLAELKYDWDKAKDNLVQVHTYSNAITVQQTKDRYENAVEEARKAFFVINNDGHKPTKEQILSQALIEVCDRAKELQERFGFVLLDQFQPFKYLYTIAQEALKDAGY